jgi:dTDP-4-dehydrorhamnose 3,5-epimerase
MKTQELQIKGVYLISNFFQEDKRGFFVKTFSNINEILKGLSFEINEIYYSQSKKNVIRGMHFQRPPMDHTKLIYLTSGKITDVLLDLRKSSLSYKQYITIDLSAHKNALLIPPGIAHGFLCKENDTVVIYNQSSVYSKDHDEGIHWNSFGHDWGITNPIVSDRDNTFSLFSNFSTPFF